MSKSLYRNHEIKTQKVGQQWRAGAIRGAKMVGTPVTATTSEAAIMGVKAQLDAYAKEQHAKRGADGYPTVEEVYAALKILRMAGGQRAMLDAHMNAPDNTLTAAELANAAGYDSYVTANSQYGTLGLNLAEEMDWTLPNKGRSGKTIWTFALATDGNQEARGTGEKVEGDWRWRLRPEVFEAMRRINRERAK